MTRNLTLQLLREQIEGIWGRGQTELVDVNYATDVVDHMPVEGQPQGRDALKDVVSQFRTAIPDMRMELHHVMSAGDHGVDVWTLSGTCKGDLFGQKAKHKRIRFSGIDIVRVADGKIADLWHVEEMAQFAQQIGDGDGNFGTPTSAASVPPPSIDGDYNPGADAMVPGEAQFSDKERRNLSIARRHIEEIWAKGQPELCHLLYHRDVTDHNPAPGQRPGVDGIIDVLGWLREAVPNLRMDIKCYIVDGDWIADRWVMTGTHTGTAIMGVSASGRSFCINGMDVARLNEAGLITDIWHCEEFASLLAQIKGE